MTEDKLETKLETKLEIYDTTLRDGEQTDGVEFSVKDMLGFTKLADEFGLHYIEAGWPFLNPKDVEYFQRRPRNLSQAKVVAFGMTARTEDSERDENLNALISADPDIFTIFGKSWGLHVRGVLRKGREEYLKVIEASVKHLKSQGKEVIYDAEHFFDGYKADPNYAFQTLQAALEGGTDKIVLCDTNGGSLPNEIQRIISQISEKLNDSVKLGIHTHNDGGLALANTLVAIELGVTHVQGTINGLGERCGNLNLCELLPRHPSGVALEKLTSISEYVAGISGFPVPTNASYVGKKAFHHKGGVHADAVLKKPRAYEAIPPESVGNQRKFPLSDQAGRAAIVEEAKNYGFELDKKSEEVKRIWEETNKEGEVGNAQFYLLLAQYVEKSQKPLEVLESITIDQKEKPAQATLEVKIGDIIYHEVAKGDGPVNAYDNALKKALSGHNPERVELEDYNVNLPPGEKGTEAQVKVKINFSVDGERFSSISRGTDIIKASQNALVDGYAYYLMRYF